MAGRIIVPEGRMAHKTVDSKLEEKKKNIADSYQSFESNYKRFNYFSKFVFETSLSQDDIALMKELNKPQLEFNILEPFISRQRGEFSKQEPSVVVRSVDLIKSKVDPATVKVIEDHFRAIIDTSNRDNMAYDTFSDQCAGGFSAWRIYTEYANDKSFNQNIRWRRTYDPTLTGFDKSAKESHKGDGKFAFEIYPKTRSEFEREYGKKYTNNMRFSRSIEGFSWSYETQKGEEVVLVCDYFEKRIENRKLVQLVDGQELTEDEYEQYLALWTRAGLIMQPPTIVNKRVAPVTFIDKYIIVENDIIEYNQTDFKHLPLIFVDGNSRWIRDTNSNAARQVTRPMVYHAEGIQKLKNFAGISLANELENMVQHKFSVQKEAIPEDYADAYTDVQKANVLVWNGFKGNDPNIPLQAPQPIPRVPAPPELMNTFTVSDQMTQSILGSYDAVLGIQGNQISGRAIEKGATQSNATAMPYIVSYMKALNRACEVTLDLIPKYYDTPRTIPTRGIDGKRTFVMINTPGQPQMEYEPDALEVRVEAGVNFEVQRSQAFEMLTQLMQLSPIFNELISTEESGLQMLLDNVDIRGIDALKQIVAEFVKKKQQQMQQQQQMAMQQQQQQMQQIMAPIMLEAQAIKQKSDETMLNAQTKAAQLGIQQQDANTRRLDVMNKIDQTSAQIAMEQEKIVAEDTRTAIEAINSESDREHQKTIELLKLHQQAAKDNINTQRINNAT